MTISPNFKSVGIFFPKKKKKNHLMIRIPKFHRVAESRSVFDRGRKSIIEINELKEMTTEKYALED